MLNCSLCSWEKLSSILEYYSMNVLIKSYILFKISLFMVINWINFVLSLHFLNPVYIQLHKIFLLKKEDFSLSSLEQFI